MLMGHDAIQLFDGASVSTECFDDLEQQGNNIRTIEKVLSNLKLS